MIGFFPEVYPDETIYSIFSRYHKRTGDLNTVCTMKELSGYAVPPPLYFNSNLMYLFNQLPKRYFSDFENFVEKHMIIKFYKPFFSAAKWDRLLNSIKESDDSNARAIIGPMGSRLGQLSGLRVCPECVVEDKEKYGEPYYHVQHQLPGNLVCYKHNQWLHELEFGTEIGLCRFIYPDDPQFNERYLDNNELKVHFYELAKNINSLMDAKSDDLNLGITCEKYYAILRKMNFIKHDGRIDLINLRRFLKEYHTNDFIEKLQYGNMESWLKHKFFNSSHVSNPIKHLLLIFALFGSFKEFLTFEYNDITVDKDKIIFPFGSVFCK